MEFKNYCIVALGSVNELKEILIKISETELRFIKQKGVFIATFKTTMFANELKTLLDEKKLTLFIFELNNDSVYKIGNDKINSQLFSGFTSSTTDPKLGGFNPSDYIMDINIDEYIPSISKKELTLNEQLDSAVENEDYEEASRLRDLIKNKQNG